MSGLDPRRQWFVPRPTGCGGLRARWRAPGARGPRRRPPWDRDRPSGRAPGQTRRPSRRGACGTRRPASASRREIRRQMGVAIRCPLGTADSAGSRGAGRDAGTCRYPPASDLALPEGVDHPGQQGHQRRRGRTVDEALPEEPAHLSPIAGFQLDAQSQHLDPGLGRAMV